MAAAPPGLEGDPPPGLLSSASEYTCDGGEGVLIYGGSGRSGWLGGELYQAVTAVAYEGGSLVFDKSWGGGPMTDDTVECTATEGLYSVTVTAVKVPGG